MKQVQRKVNIVPVIGKADALTEPEMRRLKRRIMSDIQEHDIQVEKKFIKICKKDQKILFFVLKFPCWLEGMKIARSNDSSIIIYF